MACFLVIKVNHGNTLRRFNASIDENGHLGLTINELRAKICGFFNFSPDVDFKLTYVDEDDDLVALVDEADLSNVMSQSLKFLRISVRLKKEKAFIYSKSSGSSTPTRTLKKEKVLNRKSSGGYTPMRSLVQHSLQEINAGALESLKSEPLCESLTKLSLSLPTKTTSSSSVLAEIPDSVSKVGKLCVKPSSHSQLNFAGGPCKNPLTSSESNLLNASKDASAPVEAVKHSGIALTSLTNQEMEIAKGDEDGDTISPSMLTFFDFGFLDHLFADSPQSSEVSFSDKSSNDSDIHKEKKSAGLARFDSSVTATVGKSVPSFTSLSAGCTECSLSGMPIGLPFTADSAPPPLSSVIPQSTFPTKRSNNLNDAMNGVFDRGVQCDGCVVSPITGPGYMSKWRYKYDLSSACFAEMDNEAYYTKLVQNFLAPQHTEKSFFGGFGMKPQDTLDSRLIVDVNVIDEMVMKPSTPFTKIWRMKNSGSLVWPRGTRIVWTGGDRFSDADSVELEVPADGVPIDGELDIAVDFIAPQSPGRYTSYWKMASPAGQKFGQRVHVLILVHASLKDDDTQTNLRMPLGSTVTKDSEVYSSGVHPVKKYLPDPCNADFTEPITSNVDDNLEVPGAIKYLELSTVGPSIEAPINETKLSSINSVCSQGLNDNIPVDETLLKNIEKIGFTNINLIKEILMKNDYDLEKSLNVLCTLAKWEPILRELEEMGFTDWERNMRLMKKNNGSIKFVVMDLIIGGDD